MKGSCAACCRNGVQGVREWCSSTTGPLLPSMTDSLLAPSCELLYKWYHSGELGKPGEHVQLLRMKRDCNKGCYSEKC